MPVTYTNRKGHTYYLCQGLTKTGKLRVTVHKNQIIICERLGTDVETLSAIFGNLSALKSDIVEMRLQEQLEKMARFSPILCFILIDSDVRKFTAERWSYMGDINDWIDIGESGKLEKLARRLIPKLSTDDIFELF
jgi:hypothetical protein